MSLGTREFDASLLKSRDHRRLAKIVSAPQTPYLATADRFVEALF